LIETGANLLIDAEDEILWVRINRPDSRNALNRATLGELEAIFRHHARNDKIKAAVISGEGREAFAAGGDLKELNSLREPRDVGEFFDHASAALDRIREFPVVTVAALNGRALGGGAELALACDYRVAAPHASIGYIQGSLNISTGFGGGADLAQLLGPSRAMMRGLCADVLEATAAHAAGIVDQIATSDESLRECVMRVLSPMLKRTPAVIRAFKAMCTAERRGMAPHERRSLERDWFTRTWTSAEHWSAVESMGQKRKERIT
jgi:enoyl-CoA hydratase/carnithine racemase